MSDDRPLRLRPPAVAGTFYPGDPRTLEAMVRRDLDDAVARLHDAGGEAGAPAGPGAATPAPRPAPHAVVVPHAGYVYSGPIAASAYARVLPRRGEVRRVVLLGPAHRVPLRGMAVPGVDGFATPLGVVPIDDGARAAAVGLPGVTVDDLPHAEEHSLEVQLPFLQLTLGDGWSLLPVVVGRASPESVARLLDRLWGGPETLVVVSTDLSHYHDHRSAQALDSATAAAVVARRWRDLEPDRACGAHPLRGLLAEAERLDLPVALLDLRTSGDTAGDRQRVVGYGAFAVG